MPPFYLVLILTISVCSCSTIANKDILIIYEDDVTSTHSLFFSQLRERGYTLSFANVMDNIKLKDHGACLYNQLIVLAPKTDVAPLSAETIFQFFDDGNSVLIAASDKPGLFVRELAKLFRVDIQDKILDFHLDEGAVDSASTGQKVIAETSPETAPVFGTDRIANIVFEGAALAPDKDLILKAFQLPLLRSSPTSFRIPHAPLTVGVAASNEARAAVTGSLDMFSNVYIGEENKFGNANFSRELVKWLFKERSRLQVSNLMHARVGESAPQSMYIVGDEIEVKLYLREYREGNLVPFATDRLQLEVCKVTPVIRLNMKPGPDGLYSVALKLPSSFGYYKFRVALRQPGYTNVLVQEFLPVRPLRCEERERIVDIAYPYYAGALSMLVGITILSFIVLYQK